MNKPICIYLVDDHAVVNSGIQNLLNSQQDKYEVSKTFGSGKELLYALNFEQPDLVISDISMPDMNGIELAKEVFAKHPKAKLMFLSMHKKLEFVKPALATGAQGYVLKDAKPEEVFEAIDTIMLGANYVSPKASSALVSSIQTKVDLTPREIEVLKQIAKGKTTREIADVLIISHHTVESHRKNLLSKTDCSNTAELLLWAVGEGYVQVNRES